MDCVTPPPLTEDELSSVIDGTAAPGVLEHLAVCPPCSGRLQAARQAEQLLRQGLFRWDCPSSEELGEYQLALLAPAERAAIGTHVQGCPRCQEELAELQSFLGATPAPPRPAGAWLRAVVAQLLPRPQAPALRGANGEPSASYTLPQSDAIITVRWRAVPGAALALSGQVADEAQDRWTGALVEARHAEAVVAHAAIDDLGGFDLDGLPAGEIELRIIPAAGGLVLVPNLTLSG